jgi:hypothetical protein
LLQATNCVESGSAHVARNVTQQLHPRRTAKRRRAQNPASTGKQARGGELHEGVTKPWPIMAGTCDRCVTAARCNRTGACIPSAL